MCVCVCVCVVVGLTLTPTHAHTRARAHTHTQSYVGEKKSEEEPASPRTSPRVTRAMQRRWSESIASEPDFGGDPDSDPDSDSPPPPPPEVQEYTPTAAFRKSFAGKPAETRSATARDTRGVASLDRQPATSRDHGVSSGRGGGGGGGGRDKLFTILKLFISS